jgi:DNA-binding transcriptional regulator GbsR (MarR family)
MVTMQLFSTQQLKDFISTNFTEKFERAINETNTNVMLLEEEQKSLKKTVEGLKNTTKKNKQ